MESEELNIQPKAGILGVFSRLNYKPWYAIGEFVDNSTASYFGHENIMHFYSLKKLTVTVEYDSFKNILTIIDDAYGMEIDEFKRAVLMDQKPDNLNGRNEFGMGLKTAASWFGNVWSVESTQLGSKHRYYAEVDIPKLRKENSNTIEIITSEADSSEHGTTIIIKDITKKLDSSNTKKKIKELLSSMYRRDLKSGKLELYFNGEKLSFESFEVLKFRNTEWKKQIDFSFDFNEKKYNVTGFVGIMGGKGSFPKAGLALFRYDRAVIGGYDSNYKPNEIFGQAQSQVSLKLFGELNMEDFPVNQAKDGFVWDDGLEDEFLKYLKINIKDYIDIATLSKSARAQEEEISIENSERTKDNVKQLFENIILDDENENIKEKTNLDITSEDVVARFVREQRDYNKNTEERISTVREYTIQLDPVTNKTFKVSWKISNNDKWIDYDAYSAEISININHPFFKPYSSDDKFKELLDSFVVAFVCAEELAKKTSLQNGGSENYILPSVFRNKMNQILKKISESR